MTSSHCDAVVLVSFGGPEGPDDVLPFLDNVLRGRNVPERRKLEVAEHYYHFGGVSPINQQNRELLGAIEAELSGAGLTLPVYWGNRNWHPMLVDTLRRMQDDGVRNSLALITSAYSSYSACRQYLEAIEAAREEVGPEAPRIAKLRCFFNHPRFVEAWIARTREAWEQFEWADRDKVRVLFTAHSIPVAMAEGCPYVAQLKEVATLIASRFSWNASRWQLVYQSRSGPPQQPWLEPDVCDAIQGLAAQGVNHVLLVPIGFLSDHVEVLYDLDVEAVQVARESRVRLVRARTLGTHPQLVTMVRELIQERLAGPEHRPTVGTMLAAPDTCPADCCRFAALTP